jgi:polyhydroxybutyrate depolymerase
MSTYQSGLNYIETRTGFTAKSDVEGFIVVYPEGFGASWNVVGGFGDAFSTNIDDVGFIRALIDSLQGKFAIDRNRIYVAGFSQGAMMAYRFPAIS